MLRWKSLLIASFLGFVLSFGTLTTFTYLQVGRVVERAQLIAGDPAVNRQFPTTYNLLQENMRLQVAAATLASIWFWLFVIVLSVLFALFILRVLRR
jgi:hypothetical protein